MKYLRINIFCYIQSIIAISLLFFSCNNEDFSKTIIKEINCSSDFVQFFNKECDKIIKTDNYIDSCVIINSVEHLNSIYSGNMQIPYIDFSKYTLVVGQKSINSHGWTIAYKKLSFDDNQLNMYLYISTKTELHASAFTKLFYWGLYPKLQSKNINTRTIWK